MSPPSLSPETTQVLSGYGIGLAAAGAEFVPAAWMIAGTAANTAAKTSPPATRRLMRLNNFMILICFSCAPAYWALTMLTPARLKSLNYFRNFPHNRLKDSLLDEISKRTSQRRCPNLEKIHFGRRFPLLV